MTRISHFVLIAGAGIVSIASPAFITYSAASIVPGSKVAAPGPRHPNISTQRSGLNAFAMVPNLHGRSMYSPALTGGGSFGYNENFRRDTW